MIIDLDGAFQHISKEQWLSHHEALENLISAHANGWHLLSMSRPTIAAILTHCELSITQRLIVRDIIAPKLTNILSQSKSIQYGVHCVPDGVPTVALSNRVTLPLSYFKNPNASLPATVIVESIENDAAFITFACEMFGRSLGFSSYSKLEFLAGGGGSTANRFLEAGNSGRGVLCVVDSDSYFPDGPLGDTAKAVKATKLSMPLARVHLLPVREVENLVPWSVYERVFAGNAPVTDTVRSISEFINKDSKDTEELKVIIMGHFDIKSGVQRSFLRKLNPEVLSIWLRLWKFVNPGELAFNISDCKNEADNLIIRGISSKAIGTTIDYHNRRPHKQRDYIRETRAYSFGKAVEQLVSDVLSLTAASDRLRTPVRAKSIIT